MSCAFGQATPTSAFDGKMVGGACILRSIVTAGETIA